MGFQRISFPSKYLGIPLTDKPLAFSNWESLISKLKKKISNWTFRALNLAGRLILVKSVLQAMPIYLFSAIAVPKSVSNQIRTIQMDFLWKGKAIKGKWTLVT